MIDKYSIKVEMNIRNVAESPSDPNGVFVLRNGEWITFEEWKTERVIESRRARASFRTATCKPSPIIHILKRG